jgi:hypothetical protein
MAHEQDKRRPDLEPDIPDEVGSLARDADGPFDVMFAGFLVNDSDEQFIRLYLDYELRAYVRIRREDIIHRQRARNQADVEISILRVRKEAAVEFREVLREEVEAEVMSAFLQEAERGWDSSDADVELAKTPTIPISIRFCSRLVCTRIGCTGGMCNFTSRHSAACTIICTVLP